MVVMFYNQGNLVFDYVWNMVCCCFGGCLYVRNDGIKLFIQLVCQGYWGYYLFDQDYGLEYSEFVDFFVIYKVMLFVIGCLMKVCCVCVVLLFLIYDGKMYCLMIQVCLLMDDLLEVDDYMIVWWMNEEVEIFVGL